MNKKRPTIGITGPDRGGTAAWWFSWFAIAIHGGRAIRIRPKDGIPDDELHGLIIGGGADINPKRYGDSDMENLFSKDEKVFGFRQLMHRLATILFFPLIYLLRKLFSTSAIGIDNNRDDLEFDLLAQSVKKGIPVLGICRGAQLLNIYFGGTLHQDIADYYTEIPKVTTVWPKKRILVKEKSKLHKVLSYRNVWVNALHNQAVDDLGEALNVVAREENGIIQAIEHEKDDFILGVQWHPEYMPQIPPQRRIFEELVNKARKNLEEDL